jgi:hypothetical protein
MFCGRTFCGRTFCRKDVLKTRTFCGRTFCRSTLHQAWVYWLAGPEHLCLEQIACQGCWFDLSSLYFRVYRRHMELFTFSCKIQQKNLVKYSAADNCDFPVTVVVTLSLYKVYCNNSQWRNGVYRCGVGRGGRGGMIPVLCSCILFQSNLIESCKKERE